MAQPPAPLPQGSAGEEAGAAAEGAASGLPGLGESGGDGPANAADVAVDVEEKQGHSAATEGSTSGTQSGSQAPDEAPGRVEGEEGGAPRSGPKAAAVTRSARDADSARNQKKADSSEAGAQKKNRKAVQRRPSKRSLREARVALAAQVSFPGVGGVVGGEAPTPTPLLGTEPGPRVAVDGSGPERAADRAEKTAASWASTRGNDVKASAQLLPHVEVKGVKGARGATFTDCLLPSLTLRDVEFSGPVAFKYCLIADSVFDGVSFPRGVTFLNCKFTASVGRRLQFLRCASGGKFRVHGCAVESRVSWSNCVFSAPFDATSTTFRDWVDFKACTWEQGCDMRNAVMLQGVQWTRCSLQDLILRGVSVEKKVALDQSAVEGCLDIAKAKLRDYAYCEGCLSGPRASLRLQKSILHRLLILPEEIGGALLSRKLAESVVANTRRGPAEEGGADDGAASARSPSAPSIQRTGTSQRSLGSLGSVEDEVSPTITAAYARQAELYRQAAEEYGVLKRNYHELNWVDAEDWAYYWYKVCRRRTEVAQHRARHGGSRLRSWCHELPSTLEWLFIDLGCGYGTQPLRVFKFSAVMVVSFAVLLFVPVMARGPPRDYEDMEVGFVLRSYNLLGLPWWDAALTALLVSLTVYATGFDAVDKNIDGWLSVVLALESFVGVVFFGLFVVSFSRKVLRY